MSTTMRHKKFEMVKPDPFRVPIFVENATPLCSEPRRGETFYALSLPVV